MGNAASASDIIKPKNIGIGEGEGGVLDAGEILEGGGEDALPVIIGIHNINEIIEGIHRQNNNNNNNRTIDNRLFDNPGMRIIHPTGGGGQRPTGGGTITPEKKQPDPKPDPKPDPPPGPQPQPKEPEQKEPDEPEQKKPKPELPPTVRGWKGDISDQSGSSTNPDLNISPVNLSLLQQLKKKSKFDIKESDFITENESVKEIYIQEATPTSVQTQKQHAQDHFLRYNTTALKNQYIINSNIELDKIKIYDDKPIDFIDKKEIYNEVQYNDNEKEEQYIYKECNCPNKIYKNEQYIK